MQETHIKNKMTQEKTNEQTHLTRTQFPLERALMGARHLKLNCPQSSLYRGVEQRIEGRTKIVEQNL